MIDSQVLMYLWDQFPTLIGETIDYYFSRQEWQERISCVNKEYQRHQDVPYFNYIDGYVILVVDLLTGKNENHYHSFNFRTDPYWETEILNFKPTNYHILPPKFWYTSGHFDGYNPYN